MRLNGNGFDSSTALLRIERDLRTIRGNVPRCPEFLPRAVPIRYVMEMLLHILYRNHICCRRPAKSWGVHYTKSCNTQSSDPEDG